MDIAPAQRTSKELAEYEERSKDRLIGAQFGLWNAYAAVNGVFISAASIVAALNTKLERSPFYWIIGCCGLSLVCVVFNFTMIRQAVRFLARSAIIRSEQEMTDWTAQANAEQKHASQRYRAIQFTEILCCLLLLVVLGIFMNVLSKD